MNTIADVMAPAPFTIKPTDVIGQTRDALLHSGMHCLPVADDSGHSVGIVTSWDLVEEYAAEEAVENAMTTNVKTIGAHQSVVEAAVMMRSNFIHHLVVVDDDNKIVGVVSSLDLLEDLIDF